MNMMDMSKLVDKASDVCNIAEEIASLERERQKLIQAMTEECTLLGEIARSMGVSVPSDNMPQFAHMIITLNNHKPEIKNRVPSVEEAIQTIDIGDFVSEIAR